MSYHPAMRSTEIEQLCGDACGILPSVSPLVRLFRFQEGIPRQPSLYGPSIVVIVKGEKTALYKGREIIYNERDCLFVIGNIPLECAFRATIQEALVGLILEVDPADIRDFSNLIVQAPLGPTRVAETGAPFARPVSTTPAMFDAIDRIIAHLRSPVTANLFVGACIRELLFYAMERSDPAVLKAYLADSNFTRVLATTKFIDEQFATRLRVDLLARHAGMSVTSLNRHFKTFTGKTPLQFIKAVRLTKAKMMLETCQGSVKTVAHRVGYESVSHFSRDFASLFGHPPSQTMHD